MNPLERPRTALRYYRSRRHQYAGVNPAESSTATVKVRYATVARAYLIDAAAVSLALQKAPPQRPPARRAHSRIRMQDPHLIGARIPRPPKTRHHQHPSRDLQPPLEHGCRLARHGVD